MLNKHEVGWVSELNVNVGDIGHSVKMAGVVQTASERLRTSEHNGNSARIGRWVDGTTALGTLEMVKAERKWPVLFRA